MNEDQTLQAQHLLRSLPKFTSGLAAFELLSPQTARVKLDDGTQFRVSVELWSEEQATGGWEQAATALGRELGRMNTRLNELEEWRVKQTDFTKRLDTDLIAAQDQLAAQEQTVGELAEPSGT